MKEIALMPLANQAFTIRLDENIYEITIKEINDAMGLTLVRNEIVILSNARLISNYPIIPYKYLEDGNFILLTLNDEIPYYPAFGDTQTLIYASQEEINAIRGI